MKQQNRDSVDSIILIAVVIALGIVVAFFALSGRNAQTSPTVASMDAPAETPKAILLPTLPAAGPSSTPETPNTSQIPIPNLTPRVMPSRPTQPTPLPSDPYQVLATGTRDTFDPKIIAQDSSIIVVGIVQDILPARWTTIDGRRPANPHANSNTDTIYTPVLIKVETDVKGLGIQQQLYLYAWGGAIGQDSATWQLDAMYQFKEGERAVLFLNERGQLLNNSPLWSINEHYTIDTKDNADNGYQSLPLQKLLEQIKPEG